MEVAVGSTKKIKKGAIFSYLTIIFEVLVNFLLLRYLTRGLGDSYGLYTLALNTISIFLIDFGLSQSVTRFIAKYRINNDAEFENRFLGLIAKIYLIIDAFIVISCVVVFFCIPYIYGGLSSTEIGDFKIVFIIVAIYSCLSFPFLPLNGILNGHEEFSIIKILSMAQKALTTILLACCLIFDLGLYFAVFANVISSVIIITIKAFFVFKKCQIRPKLNYRDKKLLKGIIGYTIWIAISSIASRISLSIMPTLLATTRDSATVAIFGIAITFETYAFMFSSAISNLFLPKVTTLISQNNFDAINKSSINIGKFQIMIAGLIASGFIIFGQDFLNLYLEPMYSASYLPTILLLVDVIFNIIFIIQQNVSFAMGTIKQASIIELTVSIVRLGLCWMFGYFYGILGLTICYLCGTIIINGLKCYFVYYRRQNFDIKKFLLNVFALYLFPFTLSLLAGFLLVYTFDTSSWGFLIATIIIYSIFYLFIMFVLFLSRGERASIVNTLSRRIPFVQKINDALIKADSKDAFVPRSLAIILLILSFFASSYPLNDISLLAVLFFAIIALIAYIYFRFPLALFKDKKVAKKYFSDVSLWYVIIFSILVVVSMLATKSFNTVFGVGKFLITIWSAYLFVKLFSFKTFYKLFKNLFFILCIISLFFTLVIFINGENFSNSIVNDLYFNYFYIFFSITSSSILGNNCAIFWEPGIFASFCLIALAMLIIFDKDRWYKQLPYYLVFGVSLISTGSLAGYILIVFLVPLFLVKINKKITTVLAWIITIIFGIGVIVCIPMIGTISEFFPFIAEKGVSLTTRIYAMFVDFEIFLKFPLFGAGSSYQYYFQLISESKYPGLLDTSLNTFTYLLGAYGIAGILFILFFCFAFLMNKKVSLINRLLCFLLVILIFIKEPHQMSLLSNIFIFYLANDNYLTSDNKNNPKFVHSTIFQKIKDKNHEKELA